LNSGVGTAKIAGNDFREIGSSGGKRILKCFEFSDEKDFENYF